MVSPLAVPSPSARRRRYRRALSRLEMLESRTLMSATVTSYVPGPAPVQAVNGTYDDNNNLWLLDVSNSLERVSNGVVQESYSLPAADDFGDTEGMNIVNGHNGHLYITDFFGAVDDFNLTTKSFTQYRYDTGPEGQLTDRGASATLTSDGGLWFIGQLNFDVDGVGANVSTPLGTYIYSYVVRFDINTHQVSSVELNDFNPTTTGTSIANFLTPDGANGVYVGMPGLHGSDSNGLPLRGLTQVATVSYDATSQTASTTGLYPIDTGDPNLDTWGNMTGLTADTDGTLWISIGNFTDPNPPPFRQPVYPPDQLVHVIVNTNTNHLDTIETIGIPGNSIPLGVGNLSMDSQGRLWFNETEGGQLGFYDTFEGTITTYDYPASVEIPGAILANSDASEITMLTGSNDFDTSPPLIQVTFSQPEITFSGVSFNQAVQEQTALTNILLATFTAPAGTYTATIDWGDGTTQTVAATEITDNTFAVMVPSKTFATQGTYAGSITIDDASDTQTGVLGFTSTISDTPLDVTSMTVTNPNGHFADLTLSFTDDVDSSASWFQANISWSDGSSSAGLVVADPTTPGRYLVFGTHKYKKKGTYTVTASITTTEEDAAITSSVAQATVTV